MKPKTSLILALLAFEQIVFSQWKCDYRTYGRPKPDDCMNALLSMPDASKIATPKLTSIRKFVEPQYLEPPFSQCPNEFEAPMEQLPKFWRHKSCRFALMPIATPLGEVLSAEAVSKWSFIEVNAQRLSKKCMVKKLGGGVTFIADPTTHGAIAMYAYAVGAPFEATLNEYMITSRGIYPPGEGSASNGNLAGVTTNSSLKLRNT